MFDEKTVNQLAQAVAARVIPQIQNGNGNKMNPRLLSVAQGAAYLGRSKSSVQKLIYRRQLPVVRVGRRVHLDRQDLDRLFIEGNKT